MIPWLPIHDSTTPFPPVDTALQEPDGLLAAGGNLSTQRLLMAYRQGIFPWYGEDEPILWWSPSRRCVMRKEFLHISRSMQRVFKQMQFIITHNQAFEQVIRNCAAPRKTQKTTWITPDMIQAYCRLHREGHAHSYECWQNAVLVGGIYGVSIGRIFCGESMFSRVANASKAALITVARQDRIALIDCQNHSRHLASLGAEMISRQEYIKLLQHYAPAL